MIWEPFHAGYNAKVSEIGFGWNHHIDWRDQLGTNDPKYVYLMQLFAAQDLSTDTLSKRQIDVRDFIKFNGLLVKCVNAGMMIGWMSEMVEGPCLHMVRHPCAVVSSQLKHGAFGHIDSHDFLKPNEFLDAYPWADDILTSLKSQVELLAFTWCVQNWTAVFDRAPKLRVISFEQLNLDRTKLEDALVYFGCPVPDDLDELASKDSKTTVNTSKSLSPIERLTAWKQALEPTQVTEIKAVVDAFGYKIDDEQGVDLTATTNALLARH